MTICAGAKSHRRPAYFSSVRRKGTQKFNEESTVPYAGCGHQVCSPSLAFLVLLECKNSKSASGSMLDAIIYFDGYTHEV